MTLAFDETLTPPPRQTQTHIELVPYEHLDLIRIWRSKVKLSGSCLGITSCRHDNVIQNGVRRGMGVNRDIPTNPAMRALAIYSSLVSFFNIPDLHQPIFSSPYMARYSWPIISPILYEPVPLVGSMQCTTGLLVTLTDCDSSLTLPSYART